MKGIGDTMRLVMHKVKSIHMSDMNQIIFTLDNGAGVRQWHGDIWEAINFGTYYQPVIADCNEKLLGFVEVEFSSSVFDIPVEKYEFVDINDDFSFNAEDEPIII
jgi:hypothetical protein